MTAPSRAMSLGIYAQSTWEKFKKYDAALHEWDRHFMSGQLRWNRAKNQPERLDVTSRGRPQWRISLDQGTFNWNKALKLARDYGLYVWPQVTPETQEHITLWLSRDKERFGDPAVSAPVNNRTSREYPITWRGDYG